MSRLHVAVLLLLAPATFADDTAAADAVCYGNADRVVQAVPGGQVSGDCCFIGTRNFAMELRLPEYDFVDLPSGGPGSLDPVPYSGVDALRYVPDGWRLPSCTSEDWEIIQGCGLEDLAYPWTTSEYSEDSSVVGTICCIGNDCCQQPWEDDYEVGTRACSDSDAASTVGCVEPVSEGGACVGDASRVYFIGYKVPEGTAQPAQELSNVDDYVQHSFTTFDQGVCPCVTHPFHLLLSLLPRAPRVESDVVRASPAQGIVVPPPRLHSRGRSSRTLYDAGADGIVADRRGFCRADR